MTDISKEISEILDDYSDKAVRALEHAEKKAAQHTVKVLKATAPKDKGSTGYSTGFASKKIGSGRQGGYAVYNRTAPGLTHLLEYGHVKANQHGHYPGRVMGSQHWYKAEIQGTEVFEREVRSELGG